MATFHTVWVVLETPVLIGYARISKADGSQSLDLQRDALREAGVSDDAIYEDQASGQCEDRPGPAAFLKAARQGDVIVVWRLDRLGRNLRHLVNLGACRELAPSKQESTTYEPSPVCKLLILGCRLLIPDRLLVQDLNDRDIGIRVLAGQGASIDTTTASGKLVFALFAGFGGIRTRADPGTDPRWIGLCTSQGQEGMAPSRAEQSAGAARSGSDGAARHESQRARPGARRNQGDDLPLRSARWFLEKPRATGPGSLGDPKSGP